METLFLDDGLMSLVLIIDLCLCHLNWLLKLGDLEFEKADHILSGGWLSLKGWESLSVDSN